MLRHLLNAFLHHVAVVDVSVRTTRVDLDVEGTGDGDNFNPSVPGCDGLREPVKDNSVEGKRVLGDSQGSRRDRTT